MREHRAKQEDAGITRRLIAYLLDWYIGGLATAFPISAVSMRLYGTIKNQQIMEFPSPWGAAAGFLALACAAMYYWGVPVLVWKGQTLGKRWLGLKIQSVDGGELSPGRMAARQVLGVMIVEGVVVTASTIWHQLLTMAVGINFVAPLMYLGMGVSLISSLLVLFKGHRAIHDYLGGSRVICLKPSKNK